MARINVTTNINAVVSGIEKDLAPPVLDKALASAALTALAEQDGRIFGEGKGSDGQSFGDYSPAYLKRRREEFRRSGTRIVLTATGQMKNDYTVGLSRAATLKLRQLAYALGFQNQANAKKAQWLEERYGPIFALSNKEADVVQKVVESVLSEELA